MVTLQITVLANGKPQRPVTLFGAVRQRIGAIVVHWPT
ncbi:hypothetical protein NOCARDAX2BIS_220165 [Nocardioides sp. AX2bis]|nr:hypothetical protein NOCARDAX2BIS_220165 [Nocardioides sp. AX2bis]